MIEFEDLQWGSAGDAASRLNGTLARGTCTILAAPDDTARAALAVIAGRRPPASGRIRVDGHDVTGNALARRRLVFCTDDLPSMPVSVATYLALASSGRTASAPASRLALQVSALPATASVDSLDPDARQTLGLAAALASGAPLLLVHAPFASGSPADHARRRALLSEARHEGRTLLLTGLTRQDPLADAVLEAGR